MPWNPAPNKPLGLGHADRKTVRRTKITKSVQQGLDYLLRRGHEHDVISEQQKRDQLPRNPDSVQLPRRHARQSLGPDIILQPVHV